MNDGFEGNLKAVFLARIDMKAFLFCAILFGVVAAKADFSDYHCQDDSKKILITKVDGVVISYWEVVAAEVVTATSDAFVVIECDGFLGPSKRSSIKKSLIIKKEKVFTENKMGIRSQHGAVVGINVEAGSALVKTGIRYKVEANNPGVIALKNQK